MSAELRAERLRVALTVLDFEPDYCAVLYPEPRPLLSVEDIGLARTCSTEDWQLALAWREAESDLRRREWGALEMLLAAIPLGGGLGDIYELPTELALPALHAAHACGWLREGGG